MIVVIEYHYILTILSFFDSFSFVILSTFVCEDAKEREMIKSPLRRVNRRIRQKGAGAGRIAFSLGKAIGGEVLSTLLKGMVKTAGRTALKQIGFGYSKGLPASQEGGTGYKNGLNPNQEGGKWTELKKALQRRRTRRRSRQLGGMYIPRHANGRFAKRSIGNKRQTGGFLAIPSLIKTIAKQFGFGGYSSGKNPNQEGGARVSLSNPFIQPPNNDPTKNNKNRHYRKRGNVPAIRDFLKMNPRFGNKSLHRATSGWYLHGLKAGNERKGRNAELKRCLTLVAEKMHKNGTGYMRFLRRGASLDPETEYNRLLRLLKR